MAQAGSDRYQSSSENRFWIKRENAAKDQATHSRARAQLWATQNVPLRKLGRSSKVGAREADYPMLKR